MTEQRPVYFKQLQLGPMQNFVYLIGSPRTREVAVVDPGWDVPEILRTVKADGLTVKKILITHTHYDHINGAEELAKATDAQVFVERHEHALAPVAKSSLAAVESGGSLTIGDLTATVIHTPGHTPGSQCFLVGGRLFSGDTLFVGSCGRCDLPGSDPHQLYHSLTQVLRPLEEGTIVCPGHDYADRPTSTIREEKQSNPFLAAEALESFLRMVGHG